MCLCVLQCQKEGVDTEEIHAAIVVSQYLTCHLIYCAKLCTFSETFENPTWTHSACLSNDYTGHRNSFNL